MSNVPSSSSTVIAPPPGTYHVDPELSTISLRISHLFGLGTVSATLALISAEVVIVESLTGVTVQACAATASFSSGNKGRDKRVRSRRMLNCADFPELTFVSDAIFDDDGPWRVHGTLTVGGVSAPCTITITKTVQGPEAFTIVAVGDVDRYAHAITGLRGFVGRHGEVTITAILTSGS